MTTADRYNSIRRALEQERRTSDVITMARTRNITPEAMRQRLSYYGVGAPCRSRSKVVADLLRDGYTRDVIASTLCIDRGTLRMIIHRINRNRSTTATR